jgi:hypothetical protein
MGEIAEYEQRKQKAEEASYFNSAALKMMKVTNDFQSKLKTIPDKEIVDQWGETSAHMKQTIADDPDFKAMRPRAQQKLRLHMDMWQGQSSGEFQRQADVLGSQRRVATLNATIAQFAKSGDEKMMANANAAIDATLKAGDLTPEQADQKRSMLPQLFQTSQADNLIEHAANLAWHKLNEGGFPDIKDEATRISLENKALGRWNANMVKKYQEIRKNQEAGKIYSKKELNDLAAAEELKGSSIKEALDAQGGEIAPEDIKANVSRVHDMILDIPKDASDDERMQHRLNIMASKEYQALPNPIKKQFDGDLKAGKSELPEVHRTQAEEMKRTFEDVVGLVPTGNTNQRAAPFIEGGLKKLETMPVAEIREKFGRHATREQLTKQEARREELARDWYADGQAKYRAWAQSKKGQEATPVDAEAMRVSLGFGTYSSPIGVARDFQDKKIDEATAKKLLAARFDIE